MWFQVFLSNTNNLQVIIEFQETNNPRLFLSLSYINNSIK